MSARLHPDDIHAIAAAVVALLAEHPPEPGDGADTAPQGPVLLDARQVAERFGVSREWVYAHATDLGALRLGDGPRPRLRFDAAQVAEALAAGSPSRGSQPPEAPPDAPVQRARRRRHRQPAGGRTPAGAPLLPIKGESR